MAFLGEVKRFAVMCDGCSKEPEVEAHVPTDTDNFSRTGLAYSVAGRQHGWDHRKEVVNKSYGKQERWVLKCTECRYEEV